MLNTIKANNLHTGALVHVYYKDTQLTDAAGPFIRAENSLIDKNGWNWALYECGELETIPANSDEMTIDQANEFRLQILGNDTL